MAFFVIREGKKQKRFLYGDRPFCELLTANELEEVRDGSLLGLTEGGGILSLSSPLKEGSTVILEKPNSRNLSIFKISENRRSGV